MSRNYCYILSFIGIIKMCEYDDRIMIQVYIISFKYTIPLILIMKIDLIGDNEITGKHLFIPENLIATLST